MSGVLLTWGGHNPFLRLQAKPKAVSRIAEAHVGARAPPFSQAEEGGEQRRELWEAAQGKQHLSVPRAGEV